MKSLQICFTGLVVLFLLASCNLRAGQSNNPQPSMAPAATLTITTTPYPTDIPMPTRRATYELFPTMTRGPSVTPMPVFTPLPSDMVLTIQALVTESKLLGGAREAYQCKILPGYPEPGAVFYPKEDFKAIWRVVNTGTLNWTINNVAFFFRWGTRFQPLTYREDFIPYVVNVKDQLNLQVPMHTPVEPGVYAAVWGLRSKTNKLFFCNLSIIIQVVERPK